MEPPPAGIRTKKNLPFHIMENDIRTFAGRTCQSRRHFMEGTARSALGVGLTVPFLRGQSFGQASGGNGGGGKAKSLIYLYLSGGMSHVDTFDPKSGSDIMGPSELINTKADPVKLGDKLAGLAKVADKIAVINSMMSTDGAHEQGQYIMHTAYKKIATIVHPTMGPFAEELLGRRGDVLPDSVVIGQGTSNSGYLDPSRSPLPIADPSGGVPNTTLLTDSERFDRRMEIAQKIGKRFTDRFQYAGPKSYVEYYDQATRLLKSDALQAFDLTQESGRETYGMNRLGQGCLLARRLVEKGVRVVEVTAGGWDMHQDVAAGLQTRLPELDQALAALIADLESRGLLDSTLIAVGTEFGRTPKINMNEGRDHYPAAFSTMLAGGGIRGGQVYGATDKSARKVTTKPTRPQDFIATIGYGLGVPLDKTIYSPNGRPFKFARDGEPVTEIYG